MTLFSALSYKEWMKTRQILGIFLLIFAVAVVYSIIDIRHDIRIDGADNVWYRYFFQGASVAPLFRWAPALAGLAVALSQFVPEMTNKRLKLTLHFMVNGLVVYINTFVRRIKQIAQHGHSSASFFIH